MLVCVLSLRNSYAGSTITNIWYTCGLDAIQIWTRLGYRYLLSNIQTLEQILTTVYFFGVRYGYQLCSTDTSLMEPCRFRKVSDTRVICIFKNLSCVHVSCPFQHCRVRENFVIPSLQWHIGRLMWDGGGFRVCGGDLVELGKNKGGNERYDRKSQPGFLLHCLWFNPWDQNQY